MHLSSFYQPKVSLIVGTVGLCFSGGLGCYSIDQGRNISFILPAVGHIGKSWLCYLGVLC